MKAIDRFTSKTARRGDCLEWTGATNSDGYGYFKFEGKDWRSTRWIFLFDHGYLPPVVMHLCDNPACVELRHLLPGTQADNIRDKVHKRRQRMPRGERSHLARLSDFQVAAIRALASSGARQADIAREYKIHPSHISRIVNNKARNTT